MSPARLLKARGNKLVALFVSHSTRACKSHRIGVDTRFLQEPGATSVRRKATVAAGVEAGRRNRGGTTLTHPGKEDGRRVKRTPRCSWVRTECLRGNRRSGAPASLGLGLTPDSGRPRPWLLLILPVGSTATTSPQPSPLTLARQPQLERRQALETQLLCRRGAVSRPTRGPDTCASRKARNGAAAPPVGVPVAATGQANSRPPPLRTEPARRESEEKSE